MGVWNAEGPRASLRRALTVLSASESDGDLILVTWVPEGQEPVRVQAQRAWLEIASVLDANAAVPLHERVFGSLQAAPCVVSARKAIAQRRCEDLRLTPTFVEGLPLDDACGSLAGIHVLAARVAHGLGGWVDLEGRAVGPCAQNSVVCGSGTGGSRHSGPS